MNLDSVIKNSQNKQKTNEPTCDLFGINYLDFNINLLGKQALDAQIVHEMLRKILN